MNRGLILKSLREAWVATLLFSLALMAIEAILAYVLPVAPSESFTRKRRVTFRSESDGAWTWMGTDSPRANPMLLCGMVMKRELDMWSPEQ